MAHRKPERNPLFAGRWFEDDIILLCLRWYFRFKLGYRDLVVILDIPDYAVAHYPDSLSPAGGAAIWMQYLTAFGALVDLGSLKREDSVLITAASSSVGLAAIQITKAAGAPPLSRPAAPIKHSSSSTQGLITSS